MSIKFSLDKHHLCLAAIFVLAVFLTPSLSQAQEPAPTVFQSATTSTETATTTTVQASSASAADQLFLKKVDEALDILKQTDLKYKIYTVKGTYKKKATYTKMLQREVAVVGLDPSNRELYKLVFKEDLALNLKSRSNPKPPRTLGKDQNCELVWRGGGRWGFNRDMKMVCGSRGRELTVVGIKMPYPTNTSGVVVIDSYVPYSPELNTPFFAKMGREYLEKIISGAGRELAQNDVKSRAFPDKQITEIVPMEFIESLIVNEHMDPSEFSKAVKNGTFPDLVNRVLVLVGLNREQAMKWSISKAGACCLTQFMPRTYQMVVKRYPEADLDPATLRGRQDHLNAVKASIILFDSDISAGWKSKTKETCFSSAEMLEKCLAASYNAGPGTLNRAIRRLGLNWDGLRSGLKTETKMYLKKLENIKNYIVGLPKNT